jgi:hypothetical protein
MATASNVTQTNIWTALPNGVAGSNLKLSVIVSPRLSATMSDGSTPLLSVFPDWANWPTTVKKITFSVQLSSESPEAGGGPGASPTLDDAGWKAIFPAGKTSVVPFAYQDFSQAGINSYPIMDAHSVVQGTHGTLAAAALSAPVTLSNGNVTGAKGWGTGNQQLDALFNQIKSFGSESGGAFRSLQDYFTRPTGIQGPAPLPEIDFHQGLSALASFPILLRRFGLVFDLVVPRPSGLPNGSVTVQVTPSYTTATATRDVSLITQATLATKTFRPTPQGPDYGNGMLDLSDTGRFSVIDVDVELAAHRLIGLGRVLLSLSGNAGSSPLGAQSALTTPALSSTGPTIVWSGWGGQFNSLASSQTQLDDDLQTYLSGGTPTPPTVFAEHIIRGHRFDVLPQSESSPKWHSLMGRYGTYTMGTHDTTNGVDEGCSTPGATSTATAAGPSPSDDLYITERIMRWRGWGLAVQMPGNVVNNDGSGGVKSQPNPGNPMVPTGTSGSALPQLSATFGPPSLHKVSGKNEFPFPRLRFGRKYAYRARAVDLGGNSVPVTSTDATSATATAIHYRWEPVPSPVLAQSAPLHPGESTLYFFILNDQVNPPKANTRWLFPPNAAQLLCEQHGMFDPGSGSGPSASDYHEIISRDGKGVFDIASAKFDRAADPKKPPVYFPSTDNVPTPWLSDPLAAGATFVGLPTAGGKAVTDTWAGSWPVLRPMRLELDAAGTTSTSFTHAKSSTDAVRRVKLKPAEARVVWISSALHADALADLGMYQWIVEAAGKSQAALAKAGRLWTLSPFAVIRMVHAVRLPLIKPHLGHPTVARDPGATSVDITDPHFVVDEKSTSSIDIEAAWTDPYDNPSDPNSNPGIPSKATKSFAGPAFKLTVPDPTPTGPEAQPLTITPPQHAFSFSPDPSGGGAGSIHHIGDTKHHFVAYTAIGTSRFAELFTKAGTHTFHGTTALAVSTSKLGINPTSVVITTTGGKVVAPSKYVVDAKHGTIRFTSGSGKHTYHVSFQPTVTVTGPKKSLHVPSTAAPDTPKISRILPAWQLEHGGGLGTAAGATVSRTGNFLRVFLERPWFGTGPDELLGIVTRPDALDPTPDNQYTDATTFGLDPITYTRATHDFWGTFPHRFTNTAPVATWPGHAPYTDPPTFPTPDDPQIDYTVWPYSVQFDETSHLWYADVKLDLNALNVQGTFPPPPGYFVKLAVCAFQPYSLTGFELSPITTATIAQPVPDRFVTVIDNKADHGHRSVYVTVSGPGYQGWRPPLPTDPALGSGVQVDGSNVYSPQIYDDGTAGSEHSSTMAVDVQLQNGNNGLTGNLGWTTVGKPVRLPVTFGAEATVTWGGKPAGLVKLPQATTGHTKMRLRISELDFYPDGALPALIDSSIRRPFVTFVPLN